MSVTPEDIAGIRDALAAGRSAGELRASFPHLAWSQCDAEDVDEEPLEAVGQIDIHLIDTRSHCVSLTTRAEDATGVLLAQRRTAP